MKQKEKETIAELWKGKSLAKLNDSSKNQSAKRTTTEAMLKRHSV